jgi:hexosaminidase
MRSSLCLLTALAFAPALSAQTPPPTGNLMPVPASLSFTAARLRLDSGFTAGIVRYRDARLERAVTRAVARLEARIAQPLSRAYGYDTTATLVVDVAGMGHAIPDLNEDESYTLTVNGRHAALSANTVVGAIRGLETLLQLQSADSAGFYFQGADIEDAPRFKWRGLLVDVSRHFEPVSVIERTLDAMSVVKLNVLHWHLSDDQGIRVASHEFPRLQDLASDGKYYTQDQIREVVQYAADRGIRVMPEFDVPGHSNAWFVAYPWLASAPGPYQLFRSWGGPAYAMNPTKDSTYEFLNAFIGEMATLFPDRYWHVGGDEVNPRAWTSNPDIVQWMQAHGISTPAQLQTAFNKRLFAIVTAHGRIPVGWDEIFQPDLPKEAVIQSWRSSDALAAAAKQGYQGILSAPYYLDHIETAAFHYLADPLPANTTLTPAQQQLVLGGEACMWGEFVDTVTVESRIWPRMAAVAERFWSPASVRDVPDMYRRLESTSRELAEVGIPTPAEHAADMVRVMASGPDAEMLETLLQYVRPKGFGNYGTTHFTPHTRLVDAANPDPWKQWQMQQNAGRAASGDSAAATALRADFARMRGFSAALDAIVPRAPLAADGSAVAAVLGQMGAIGDQALDVLAGRRSATAGWRATSDSALRQAGRRTYGLLRTVGADAVQLLVDSAAKALPPSSGTP